MAKAANPTRGYVPCPVCQSTATAHQVGEGKLIEQGEPPKNSRNLGLYYYKCPECGNSSMSKKTSEYVESRMKPSADELEASVISDQVTEKPTVETGINNPPLTVEPDIDEASQSKVPNRTVTEPETVPTVPFLTRQRVLMGLGVLIFAVWIWFKLKPKTDQTEPQPEAN